MHRKKCKARCVKCKRVFVTTNVDKLFMRRHMTVICNGCQDAFAQSLLSELLDKIMVNSIEANYKRVEVKENAENKN